MKEKILNFVKKETVLTVSFVLAVISMFFVHPDKEYLGYIDFRSLGILWSLMIIMQGLKSNGVFETIGRRLLNRTGRVWQLCSVLIFLCFFSSMLITNDVSLITFVPFAVAMLENCGRENLLVPVITLQTVAANLGSMLTPIGNPQNLYLYGISDMAIGDFILWMLPYSAISLGILILCIFLLKGKGEKIAADSAGSDEALEQRNTENEKVDAADEKEAVLNSVKTAISDGTDHILSEEKSSGPKPRNRKIIIYTLLFLTAILTVIRILPFEILVLLVLVVVFFMERRTLVQIDYALLFTFVGFFLFTGNLGRIPSLQNLLHNLIADHEVLIGVFASQFISNVPATLLLSGFSDNYKALLIGVNIGGLGTLIASMASLISYKILAHAYPEKRAKYLGIFTLFNVIFLTILLAAATLMGTI